MTEFEEALSQGAAGVGLHVGDEQIERCATYAGLLLEWNRQVNLTRIVEPREMAIKHFIDSATVLLYDLLPAGARLVDVGTGAGFPGLVLKVLRPDLEVALVDSLAKRLRFLEAVVDELKLSDVSIIHARAEDLGRRPEHREQYDVAVARAVAELRVLAEYLLPLVKVGGTMVALKGPDVREEVEGARRAVEVLGGGDAQLAGLALPFGYGERTIVWYPKHSMTPAKYPRKAGEPARRPLG